MKDYLLFIHTFTHSGCDNISWKHGKGKFFPFEKLKQGEPLRNMIFVWISFPIICLDRKNCKNKMT